MIRSAASAPVVAPSTTPLTAEDPGAPARAAIAALASGLAAPVASGAHDLQDLLARRLDEAPRAKWSMRATLTFVVLVCGGFWAGVFLAVWMLIG